MTIMKVHYSPTDGIPLNSLYLKETSTTERSGSVLGGGISGDSVILGGGGYAGSEMQKTTRLLSLHHLMKLLLSLTTQKWSSGFPVLSV